MPKALGQEVRAAIKAHLLEGKLDHLQIADEVGASLQTVKNYSSNLRNFGDVLPSRTSRIGRTPVLTKEMIDVYNLVFNHQ
jgi:hypothetical protein